MNRQPLDTSSFNEATARASIAAIQSQIVEAAMISGRTADDVTVVAAVKYVDEVAAEMLVRAGVTDLAENRVEQLLARRERLTDSQVTWHYIGRLQSRQAPQIAANVDMIHSLCTASAAKRIAGAVADGRIDAVPSCLLQVNIDGDENKDGLAAGEVASFIAALPDQIAISGFMIMPAFADAAERSRPAFAAARELLAATQTQIDGRHNLQYLSMGTSQDWRIAIEEGATHVRLGRVLFTHDE